MPTSPSAPRRLAVPIRKWVGAGSLPVIAYSPASAIGRPAALRMSQGGLGVGLGVGHGNASVLQLDLL
jgi:hypothetical protein